MTRRRRYDTKLEHRPRPVRKRTKTAKLHSARWETVGRFTDVRQHQNKLLPISITVYYYPQTLSFVVIIFLQYFRRRPLLQSRVVIIIHVEPPKIDMKFQRFKPDNIIIVVIHLSDLLVSRLRRFRSHDDDDNERVFSSSGHALSRAR